MKWEVKKEPYIGQKRTVYKFAWLPTIAEMRGVEYNVWLETYVAEQEYMIYSSFIPEMGRVNVIGWKTISKRVMGCAINELL